jgi:hypothetical protein
VAWDAALSFLAVGKLIGQLQQTAGLKQSSPIIEELMSASLPVADSPTECWNVRFVPIVLKKSFFADA